MKITLKIADLDDWVLAGRSAIITHRRWEKLGSNPKAELLNEVEFENGHVFNCRRTLAGNIIVERVI